MIRRGIHTIAQLPSHLPAVPNIFSDNTATPVTPFNASSSSLRSLPGIGYEVAQAPDSRQPPPPALLLSTRPYDASGNTFLFLPPRHQHEPIVISAKTGWKKPIERYDLYFLEGDCSVRQGSSAAQGPRAVIWVERRPNDFTKTSEVTVYLESGPVDPPLCLEIDPNGVDAKIFDQQWIGEFTTTGSINTFILEPTVSKGEEHGIYQRALGLLSPSHNIIRQTQYVADTGIKRTSDVKEISRSARFRRFRLVSRDDGQHDMFYQPDETDPSRGIGMLLRGFNIVIEDVDAPSNLLIGRVVDISADNAIYWGPNIFHSQRQQDNVQDSSQDFEIYLEGNIIFRDGPRTIQASRMYYDAKNDIAHILDGKMTTPIIGVAQFAGYSMQLRADVLQKLGEGMFSAKNVWVSTSQLGEPTYALHSRTVTLNETTRQPLWDGDKPVTRQMLVGESNYMTLGKLPVFYWPWMATDLRNPTFYLRSISYGHSSILGHQVKTEWDPFQLLNWRKKPDWLDGSLNVSWLELRGVAHGVKMQYSPPTFFGIPGKTSGHFTFWGIEDRGKDRLGGPRRDVTFPDPYRYRVKWQQRQELESLGAWKGPWFVTAQVGKTSDRNLMNSYFPTTWNNDPNQTTAVNIKKVDDNHSLSLHTEYDLDGFQTNTNWLPRLDHYGIGGSFLKDYFTWYGHTRVGYAQYHVAPAPSDWNRDGRYFRYFPWELTPNSPTNAPRNPLRPTDPQPTTVSTSAEVFSSRHEVDLPFNVGPVRCVPYALGDFSHWGKDRTNHDLQRLYGQTGVRLNLPFWKIFPYCSSQTWYVNSLAHKFDLDAEISYARSDTTMENLIMYDGFDRWSLEDARRRYMLGTYGKKYGYDIPMQFDPRYYALRTGYAGNVTAQNMEIADDLTLCRLGMTHRLQTKRGPVGRRRVVDWITFSTHFNYYPDSHHNYGQDIGLVDYDLLWHVGDRFAVFSSGLYDLFDDGEKISRVGLLWQRPKRGSISTALDQFDGIIKSKTYLTLSAAYDMNEKYAVNYSTSFDIHDNWKSLGHNFMFTRTGESFRILVGAVYNQAKNEWAFTFGVEPVFLRGIAKKLQNLATSTGLMQSN